MTFNPELDLRLERIVAVPAHKIWEAWTVPAKLMPWFCPKPWRVSACEIDLRPGGKFYTLMEGPNGESMPNTGCFLEIIPDRKLVWTSALGEAFRPNAIDAAGFPFTGMIELSPHGEGTKYVATVLHHNEKDRGIHAQMGFEAGWGAALDQMVTMIEGK